MLGKKRSARPVIDPASDLAPFEVVNPDPGRWVHIPRAFPTPQDKNSWDWALRNARLHEADEPADDTMSARRKTDLGRGRMGGMVGQTRRRYPAHSSVWGLLPHPLTGVEYLSVVFDLEVSSSGSAAGAVRRLVAGPDDRLEVHPEGYREQESAPARVLPIDAAGLGGGTCVIRQDRHQLMHRGLDTMLDDEHRRRYQDPDFWHLGVSVHWVFTVAGRDLQAGVRSDKLTELHASLPKIFQLLDAILVPGQAPQPVDEAARADIVDALGQIIAAERAHDARLAERYGAERADER